jgi:hypothetical protein
MLRYFHLKCRADSADSLPDGYRLGTPCQPPLKAAYVMQQHPNSPVWQVFVTRTERSSGFGHCRRFTLIIAAFMGILISSWASSPYLPTVGPAPLRFRPAFKPNTNVVVRLAAVPAPKPVVQAGAVEKVEKATPPALLAPAHDAAPTNDPSDAVIESVGSATTISPQMLLKYFNKPQNGAAVGTNAPVDFTLPRAGAPPSSKAEFTTPSP